MINVVSSANFAIIILIIALLVTFFWRSCINMLNSTGPSLGVCGNALMISFSCVKPVFYLPGQHVGNSYCSFLAVSSISSSEDASDLLMSIEWKSPRLFYSQPEVTISVSNSTVGLSSLSISFWLPLDLHIFWHFSCS